MLIAHLLASPFFGGPERQVLELANELRGTCSSFFLSFAEGGRAQAFLAEAKAAGFEAVELRENWPHVVRVTQELTRELRTRRADLLCTNGYKPDILGLPAARMTGIPAVSIAHGWTGATRKVRLNETLDRWAMRRFDAVVSVSESQADKVRQAGVAPHKVVTIPNAITPSKEPAGSAKMHRQELDSLFDKPPHWLVGAAGRLSPEKGFDVLIDAAAMLTPELHDVGFIVFGEGPLREQLAQRIDTRGVRSRVVLAGFRRDLDQVLPSLDVLAISSRTEGLPVILLEALGCGLPVVATAVGGIPEVIVDGQHGLLVPVDNAALLAHGLSRMLHDGSLRTQLQFAGPQRIATHFSTALQAERYYTLFTRLLAASSVSDRTR